MARPRILHVFDQFDRGDAQMRTARLINHFGDRAEHVIVCAEKNVLALRDRIAGGLSVEFPVDDILLFGGRPGIVRYQQLAHYMKRFSLILTYGWGGMNAVMAHTLLGKRAGLRPLIHHEDGFDEKEAAGSAAWRNWFRTIALQRSDHLIVPSRNLHKYAQMHWHVPPEKIVRIPTGIETGLYKKTPQKGSFPGFVRRKGEILLLCIAPFLPSKNLPMLVRAAAAAGPDIRLALVGEGPEEGAIRAEIDRSGMAGRVMMPGAFNNDLRKRNSRFMGLFDIFVLPSVAEQYPVILAEAMAAGCPAIVTDAGDMATMISALNRPFVVPPGDEAALAANIRKLADDIGLREKLGNDNRQKAFTEFGEGTMLARYRQLYGSAMGRADFARQA